MYDDALLPAVFVEPAESAPAQVIKPEQLAQLGQNLSRTFDQYKSDRRIAELKWTRNLRQYLGIYDPDVEAALGKDQSRAYPRVTRVKVISVVSRLMNLMFPGDERNWEISASPSPDMAPEDVQAAVQSAMQKMQEAGLPPQMDEETIEDAVQRLADERAEDLMELIDDQLQEIGGDQTNDYVALNRKVVLSGVLYGLGVIRGPFVRTQERTTWGMGPMGQMMPTTQTLYKPQFEFLPVWDFYPDMSAKTFAQMDGYFIRLVMSRAQVRALANRPDFFGEIIRKHLADKGGNYKEQQFESELRNMGVASIVNPAKADSGKYELTVWNGPVSGRQLSECGVEVAPDAMGDDVEAEIWMIGDCVIKADINPWRKIDADVKTIHTFIFDEDDTSPVGNGLPAVIRDSQMSISAATRMLLDNASVVCGPNLEINMDLMLPNQDVGALTARKFWYREGTGAEANVPAVRNIVIESHIDELLKTIDLFMKFVDMESFVGPATGGDMERAPSEPMRTVAGASMIRGDAALPFKDVVRNYDTFTQSVIQSLIPFNRKFNPDAAPEGDYNVIARGASSLVAKELRGMQVDALAQTLTPQEMMHVDDRKFVEARFAVRDLKGLLVPPDEAKRRKQASDEQSQMMQQYQVEQIKAETRKTLSDAYKAITQGAKNTSNADAVTINAALDILEKGMEAHEVGAKKSTGSSGGSNSGKSS